MLTGQILRYILTTAQEADGDQQHEPILAADFPVAVISLEALGGSVGLTVKIKGSYEDPNQLPTKFEYLESKNNALSAYYAGAVGYTFAAAGRVDLEVNVNEITWLLIEVSGHTNGTLNAACTLSSNMH